MAAERKGDAMRDSDSAVIVAAGTAWPFYRLVGGYVCQPGRTFRNAGRMGFYSRRQVHGLAARIESILPSVQLSASEAARRSLSVDPVERRVGDIMSAALAEDRGNEVVQIVILSTLRDEDTLKFDPVLHEGPHAWTQNQRYVRVSALMRARTTDDLVDQASEDVLEAEDMA
jgi:hypothetical protein